MKMRVLLLLVLSTALRPPAFAQTDFSGEWFRWLTKTGRWIGGVARQ